MRALLRRLRAESGVAMVFVALTLPVVLGMTALSVDVGRTFVLRRELQNATDAAALAAAAYLPSTDAAVLAAARQAAVEYASLNGVTITPDDVEFLTDVEPYDRAVVRAQRDIELPFGRILAMPQAVVGSQSAAQIGVLGGVRGVMPWGLQEPAGGFQFGEQYCLKLGSGDGDECAGAQNGNFNAIDIDDVGNDSSAVYRDKIINGSEQIVRIGDIKSIVHGNKVGPTEQGTGCAGNGGRISGNNDGFEDVVRVESDATGSRYTVLDWESPRLILIPTIRTIDQHDVEVLGFAVFFLEGCTGNGGVSGRFIETMVSGGEWAPYAGSESGARAVRLSE